MQLKLKEIISRIEFTIGPSPKYTIFSLHLHIVLFLAGLR